MRAHRWGSVGLVVLGLGVIGAGLLRRWAGEPAPGQPAAATVAAPAPSGEALYLAHCATCHMVDGGGVPNFQPGLRDGPIVADGASRVAAVIRGGSAALRGRDNPMGWEMPPFGFLADAEVAALAAYVVDAFGPPGAGGGGGAVGN